MFVPYIVLIIILCCFILLFFYNFKNYNHDVIINDDLKELKKPEIYEKIIKKNVEQIAIKNKINIQDLLEHNEQLKLDIHNLEEEIKLNDYENKNKKLEKDLKDIIEENSKLNKQLEELKDEIQGILENRKKSRKIRKKK